MDSFQFPEWYKSSAGPGISKTIFNTLVAVVPAVNLFLVSLGYHSIMLPANLDSWISLGAMAYFGIQILIGHVRSKKIAEDKMKALKSVGGISNAQFNQITKI